MILDDLIGKGYDDIELRLRGMKRDRLVRIIQQSENQNLTDAGKLINSGAKQSNMNNQTDPNERYEATIYTEKGGCVGMASFETRQQTHNWIMAQLKKVRVERPLIERAWQVRDRQENKVLQTDGPAHLIKHPWSGTSLDPNSPQSAE
jgi:hypothetical protein